MMDANACSCKSATNDEVRFVVCSFPLKNVMCVDLHLSESTFEVKSKWTCRQIETLLTILEVFQVPICLLARLLLTLRFAYVGTKQNKKQKSKPAAPSHKYAARDKAPPVSTTFPRRCNSDTHFFSSSHSSLAQPWKQKGEGLKGSHTSTVEEREAQWGEAINHWGQCCR